MCAQKKYQDNKKLIKTYNSLRKRAAKAIKSRDYMTYHAYVQYKTRYVLSIGALEHEFLQVENNLLRLRRKIEMIHSLLDKNEKVNLNVIEQLVNKEFQDDLDKLEDMGTDIEIANILKNENTLNIKDKRELEKVYSEMVLSLHPDINPEQLNNNEIDWEKILWVYDSSDLETLVMLKELLIDDAPDKNEYTMNSIQLKNRIEDLKKIIAKINREIDDLRNNFPFDLIELLEDNQWIEDRQEEIKENTALYEEVEDELEKHILQILPESTYFKS
ncbi:MAG: hypothetical protein ACQEP4_07180 [Bacillota bacterium]